MAKGICVNIGVNNVDPAHYCGGAPALKGCVNDACAMRALAKAHGFDAKDPLLDDKAVSQAVLGAIDGAASTLERGDTFLLTFSGHGGMVLDTNGDERVAPDETWCLYDRQLLDDELCERWGCFKRGVRIVVLSDSCFSGGVLRLFEKYSRARSDAIEWLDSVRRKLQREMAARNKLAGGVPAAAVYRTLGPDLALCVNAAHAREYAAIQERIQKAGPVTIGATVLLLSACQEGRLARDCEPNGLFTAALLAAWADGPYLGSYVDLANAINRQTSRYQEPFLDDSVGVWDPEFKLEKPFTI
ncbi:MAG: hypothetical protein JWM27_2847 [Gemmatimonadetes bacterium]|nr:hypothetical protein [Gemmatimonadota bacterium]